MSSILDRYVVREVVLPFLLWVLVLTFVLEIPPILQQGERLIAKGVEWSIVIRVLLTLLPQALSITIPMSLLVGLLVGLGRLSADREFVALQSCGVSIFRLLRPVAFLAVCSGLATAYVLIVSLPNANQTFREITYRIVATQAASDVKPRVFFDNFPNHVLYVREVPPTGGWNDVFLADSSRPDQTTVFFAKSGQLILNAEARSVQLLLNEGTRHTILRNKPEEYEATVFDRVLISLDPETVFPRVSLVKGEPEMTIAELRASIAEAATHGDPGYAQRLMIQQKFSFPVACGVLALLALGLGVTNRKDGKLASFVLGLAIIFAYYVLLWTARSMAKGGAIPAELAPWAPNILLGLVGVALLVWRAGAADHPIRITVPVWATTLWSRVSRRRDGAVPGTSKGRPAPARRPQVVIVLRVPHLNLPGPGLLDRYVSRQYLTVFSLAFFGMLGLFYISTFMDVMEKLVRGAATGAQLVRYFYYLTPQYIYFVIPISALLSTLVTIGLLTKNSELIVMRACGVSLYRSALPMLLFALVASGVLYGLQENVLAESNRQAEALRHVMNGFPAQTFGVLDRRWMVAGNGDLYHYEFFDPRANRFSELSVFHLGERVWQLDSLTHAQSVALLSPPGPDGRPALRWQGANGWLREFATGKKRNTQRYTPFPTRDLALDPPDYFKTDEPEPDRMTYQQLKHYIEQLQASGFHVVPYVVALQRKIAFPFVTVIMTLLAIPFAVTTGRRGSLYGVGVGIVLAIVYWTMQSVFGAVGAGGLISPTLAAWAPNILFAAAAAYLILTVRT